MAKCIYIYSRKAHSGSIRSLLRKICNRLAPDNIVPAEPLIKVRGCLAYAAINPTAGLLETDDSVLMGQVFDESKKWNEPLEEFPDGSYAIFRSGEQYCEMVSDPVASRTIWYYFDHNMLVASTSQRAIIMFIGNFAFEERVIPWILSTGTLGPTFSWDKRIKHIPADSSIILNKKTWTLTTKSNPIQFNSSKRTVGEHMTSLMEAFKATFRSLNLNYSQWALPLSGGYDSRGILCLLSKNSNIQHLQTVTWGLESAKSLKRSDAEVAKKLADKLKVPHKYHHIDLANEPVETIMDRFVLLGEGRIDHLAAYTDGFKVWKTLFEDGIKGTVRGDESFGWLPVSSPLGVRLSVGCALCSDFSNLRDYKKYGFASQELPPDLQQKDGESLSAWRDRLYQQYRSPIFQAALADLKLSYVEQISPFQSKKILQHVRQLPDRLRTEKMLFKKIIRSLSPKVSFARFAATAPSDNILRQKQIAEFLKNELSSIEAKKILPPEFLDSVLQEIKWTDNKATLKANSFSLKSFIKKNLPQPLKKALRKVLSPTVDPNVLAFRVFLIYKMTKVLNEDATANS
jgi:asparagine synthetase B (glutamine-hydrolysing)